MVHKICISLFDNLLGKPQIDCGIDSINVNFATKNPFIGRVYIKGMSHKSDCTNSFTNNTNEHKGFIEIKFATCGMQRERRVKLQYTYISAGL